MSNQEVARDIMTLAQTIQEGMEHINSRMQEGTILNTSDFFNDIISAVTSIFRSFQSLLPQLDENRVIEFSNQLITAMEVMTAGYEQRDEEKTAIALLNLLPVYDIWQNELDRCLRLYTAC